MRLLPMWYTRWALRRLRVREGQPAVVYFHPWELDPGQPRLPGKWKSKLRHYVNLGRMEGRIRELLSGGRFVPLRDYLRDQLAKGALPTHQIHSPATQAK